MDKAILEALKQNTEAVCLMPEELRKTMLSMDSKLFECLQTVSGPSSPEWRRVTCTWTHDTDATQTFKLIDDYSPTPEVKWADPVMDPVECVEFKGVSK